MSQTQANTLLDHEPAIGTVVRYNDDPCVYLGRCDRADEGIIGYDVKLRPLRLNWTGRDFREYTFVGSPDAAEIVAGVPRG